MRILLIVTLLPIAAMIAIGVTVSWMRVPAVTEDPTLLLIDIPEGYWYGGALFGRHLDISADGTKVVFVGRERGKSARLYLLEIGDSRPKEIVDSQDGHDPSFSPDGRYVAFFARGQLKRADLNESTVSIIAEIPEPRGIAWLDNDNFILGNIGGGLLRIGTSQPQPVALLPFTGPQIAHLHPEILPGKKAVLFTLAIGSIDNARPWVADLETGHEHPLLEENAFAARYVPTGHIVFGRWRGDRELMAARFDLEKLRIVGAPEPVLSTTLSGRGSGGSTDYSISATGTLIYTPSVEDVLAELVNAGPTQIHVKSNWFDELRQRLP
jgi:serine/threonine-protein kinase